MAEGTNGAGDTAWVIPPEMRTDPSLKDFKSAADMVKSLVETKKLVGSSLRPPAPEAGPEAHKAFVEDLVKRVPGVLYLPDDPAARAAVHDQLYKALGVPDKPEEYVPPKGFELEPMALSALRAQAQAERLTKSQFEARAKAQVELIAKLNLARTEAIAAAKVEFGQAFQERCALAAAAAAKIGLSANFVNDLKVGAADVSQIKAMLTVAKQFSEGGQGALQLDGAGGSGRLSNPELDEAMAAIRQSEAYKEGLGTLRGRAAVARHQELAKQRWPEG